MYIYLINAINLHQDRNTEHKCMISFHLHAVVTWNKHVWWG